MELSSCDRLRPRVIYIPSFMLVTLLTLSPQSNNVIPTEFFVRRSSRNVFLRVTHKCTKGNRFVECGVGTCKILKTFVINKHGGRSSVFHRAAVAWRMDERKNDIGFLQNRRPQPVFGVSFLKRERCTYAQRPLCYCSGVAVSMTSRTFTQRSSAATWPAGGRR